MTTVTLIDPTLETVGASAEMALRPRSLDGLTIGLLNNCKGNADLILDSAYGMLRERYGLTGSVNRTKDMPSKPFRPEVLDEVAEQCQIAITAVGD